MGSRSRLVITTVVLALAVTGLAAAGSAQTSKVKVYKFLVIGKVVGGEQSYQREPYPNESYTLGGSDTSTWIFRWHIKVIFKNGAVYSPVANAFSLAGSAKGEFHGGYPRPNNQPPAFYQCNWGPLEPRDLIEKDRFYVTGNAASYVGVLFGVDLESDLPKATCTGDTVDPLVSTTVGPGVFTGVEQGCGNALKKLRIPSKRFRLKKQFDLNIKFHWGPQSAQGQASTCNGFGDPVLSGGAGTWKFHFRRL